MLRLAICDDIKEDRDFLIFLINRIHHDENSNQEFDIHTFTCGEDLINHYENTHNSFDIIFLDIYMTGKSGMEAARRIREFDTACKIIFVTSSTDHAIEGYGVFAFNYLVKPIRPETFELVFKKAIGDTITEKANVLSIKSGNKVHTIQYKEIRYIEIAGKIVKIHTLDGAVLDSHLKLDEIEKMLIDPRFLRSHKSFLVNMDHVAVIEEYSITMTGHINVPIRQKGYSGIKKKYFDYILKKYSESQ